MYKALRVPVSLLHQKIYDTSTRLDRRTPIETKKSAIVPVIVPAEKKGNGWTARVKIEYMGYIRKFFYKKDDYTLVCRMCEKEAKNVEERTSHYNDSCYMQAHRTLRMLKNDRTCAVCERELGNDVPYDASRDDIPVCSEPCLELWDIMSPDAFKQELAVVRELEKRDGALYHS